jgi:hypothetical protein
MKTITLVAGALAFGVTLAGSALADTGECSTCVVRPSSDDTAIPQTLPDQRVGASKPIIVASPRCPSGKRVMGRCLQ